MLDRLTLSGKRVIAEEPLLVDLRSRIRDVRMSPEGAVYVLTDNGKLLKLTPQ
jgi:glucose/arabinose dehydrogenase